MQEIDLLECCPRCGEFLSLDRAVYEGEANTGLWLVKRCPACSREEWVSALKVSKVQPVALPKPLTDDP